MRVTCQLVYGGYAMTDPHAATTVDLEAALDFINTLRYDDAAPSDAIPDLGRALDWFVEHGAMTPEGAACVVSLGLGRAAASRLATIHHTRAALREIVDAIAEGRPASSEAVAVVNRALRSREVLALIPAPGGVVVGEQDGSDPIGEALARLVEPVVALVAEGRPDRLHVCADDTCRWVFFDVSRSGRRRWCDMATCGNRAKARRHRERLRAATL